jgi:hypothetical protein
MSGKALDSTRAFGHERSHIQSTQTTHVTRPEILKINWTIEPSGWLSGLYDMRERRMEIFKPQRSPRAQRTEGEEK